MLATLWFLAWQAAVLLAATRIAMAMGRRQNRQPEEFAALVVSSAIVLEAFAGSALSFARVNSAAAYAVLTVTGFAWGGRRTVAAALWSNFRGLALWRFRATASVIGAAAIPLFFLTLTPIEEPDSANYLHYLLEWRAGRLTPYTFSTNYVAFGPSRFMPALVLTRSDWFFGFVALEPLVLMALGLFLIGGELEIPPRLRIWTVAAACALQHLWGCHSGVGTLKSDSLHAAGAVLLGLVLLRAARHRAEFPPALFAFGATFATEKYTGIFLCIFAVAVLGVLRVRLVQLLPAALLFAVTTGHYYLRSLLRSGNPFYPFTVRLGPIELPGTGDLSATSIVANWRNPKLWGLLFAPSHGLSPAGLLFPPMLALVLIAAAWILVTGLRRRPPAFWLAGFFLLGWMLFARTFWGAGPHPNDLGFLETDLSTLRYVEGFLSMGELFLIWYLWRRGVRQSILLALVGLNGASRLWLLYSQPNLRLFPLALWTSAAVITGLVMYWRPPGMAVAVAAGLIVAAPAITERNRESWFPQWKPIWQPIRELAPARIFLFDDPATDFSALHFALCGPGLKHDVRTGTDARDTADARYLVRLAGAGPAPFSPSADYRPVLESDHGAVFERMREKPWDAGDLRSWYLPRGTMAAVGVAVDSTRRLQAGELATNSSFDVLRLGDRLTERLVPAEGATFIAQNCGTLDRGRPHGLLYRYHGGRWEADRPRLPLPATPVVSIDHGKFQLERLSDEQGPYLRIRALNDAQWLVMVAVLPPLAEGVPFTSLSTARCAPGRAVTFWLWTRAEVSDFAGPTAGEWHSFDLLRRVKNPARDDHLAIGLKDARAGDFFDVRELGALEGLFP